MKRTEYGLEWLVVATVVGFGLVLGVFAGSWKTIVVGSVIVGILLNIFLLVRAAVLWNRQETLGTALIIGVPAGLYDAMKILLIGVVLLSYRNAGMSEEFTRRKNITGRHVVSGTAQSHLDIHPAPHKVNAPCNLEVVINIIGER